MNRQIRAARDWCVRKIRGERLHALYRSIDRFLFQIKKEVELRQASYTFEEVFVRAKQDRQLNRRMQGLRDIFQLTGDTLLAVHLIKRTSKFGLYFPPQIITTLPESLPPSLLCITVHRGLPLLAAVLQRRNIPFHIMTQKERSIESDIQSVNKDSLPLRAYPPGKQSLTTIRSLLKAGHIVLTTVDLSGPDGYFRFIKPELFQAIALTGIRHVMFYDLHSSERGELVLRWHMLDINLAERSCALFAKFINQNHDGRDYRYDLSTKAISKNAMRSL